MADNVQLNAPTSSGATIATDDIGGVQHQLVKVEFGGDGVATPVSGADPLPVTDAAVLAKLSADPATQTTLAALLAKVIAAPSTEAKQDIMITGLAAILAKIITAPATEAKQDSQTTLLTTLNSLIETNNILAQRLEALGSAMNAGAPALRTIPIASVSTAVTGTLTAVTTVGTITNFGTAIPAKEMADDINNFTVTLANINNVTA